MPLTQGDVGLMHRRDVRLCCHGSAVMEVSPACPPPEKKGKIKYFFYLKGRLQAPKSMWDRAGFRWEVSVWFRKLWKLLSLSPEVGVAPNCFWLTRVMCQRKELTFDLFGSTWPFIWLLVYFGLCANQVKMTRWAWRLPHNAVRLIALLLREFTLKTFKCHFTNLYILALGENVAKTNRSEVEICSIIGTRVRWQPIINTGRVLSAVTRGERSTVECPSHGGWRGRRRGAAFGTSSSSFPRSFAPSLTLFSVPGGGERKGGGGS